MFTQISRFPKSPRRAAGYTHSEIKALPLYPEGRDCQRPTTRRLIDAMGSLSRHRLATNEGDSLDLYTNPTPLQHKIMKLFGIKPSTYGRKK